MSVERTSSIPLPNPKYQVAVVILTFSFDRLTDLERCMKGVLTNTRHPDQLLVVVDSNQDLEAYVRAKWQPLGVDVVANRGKGCAAGRNTAIAESEAHILVFIDDDAHPRVDWLETIVSPFRRPGVVAVGGKIDPEYDEGAMPVAPALLWLVGCTYHGHPTRREPITRPIGASMAFRREALLAVGGFNPRFGPVGEKRVNANEELPVSEALRARFGQDSIWFEPSAVVYHRVPAVRTDLRWQLRRAWVEGQSKAEVRRDHDRRVLRHDRMYLVSTLLPMICRYSFSISSQERQFAVRMVLVGLVTCLAYSRRRLAQLSMYRSKEGS